MIEVWKVNHGRIREGEIANRIMLGEGDHRTSRADLSLHWRGRGGRDEERGEGAQQAGCRYVELRLELVEMLITALAIRQVHKVPGEEWIRQREVCMNTCDSQSAIIQVDTFFEITPFCDPPISGDGMMTDVRKEEQVAMPVVQTLTKIDTRAVKRVDQCTFHQACFIDRAARTVIWPRRPLDHPVKDLKLAKLRLPVRETFCAQIIHEGLLAGSCTHSEEWAQVFIEEVPFLFEAVQSALRFFFDGLFYGEEVFIGKFLGIVGHENSLL